MLDDLAKLTAYLGEHYDLAEVNFYVSWAAAFCSAALMVFVSKGRDLKTFDGRVAWARTCGLFWLTVVLALAGSYPVDQGSQPWLPQVMLAAATLILVAIQLIAETHKGEQRSVLT